MALRDKLNLILQYKNDIKTALLKKKAGTTDDMSSYAQIIDDIIDIKPFINRTLTSIKIDTPIKWGNYMFYSQTNLTDVDFELYSTDLTRYQYENMFNGCSNLKNIPNWEFKSFDKTNANGTFRSMFYNCSKLNKVPILSATQIVSYCYSNMFYGCTSLTTAPALPATTLATNCYASMFRGCTSLTTAPELPATTLESDCYYEMFRDCTSLTEAPALPATTLAIECYRYMFQGCTSLQKTGIIAASGSISSQVYQMFYGCTSLKEMTWTATTPPTINTNIWTNCPKDMIIYVPDASVEAYKAASVWSSRAAYIKPISEKPTA